MSVRYYVAQVAGTGTVDDPYRPNLPAGVTGYVALMPSNPDGTPRLAYLLCLVDGDHDALALDSSLHQIPLTPMTPMSTIPNNQRNQYQNRIRQAGYDITIDWANDLAQDVVDRMAGAVNEPNARGGMALGGRGWGS